MSPDWAADSDAGEHEMSTVVATCHCGALAVEFAAAPAEVTECNCSLCRRYGVLWAYCAAGEVIIPADP